MKKIWNKNSGLLLCVIILCCIGFVFIYSASSYNAKINLGNPFHFVIKQVIGFLIGLVLLIITSKINYHKLYNLRWYVLVISIIMLVLVFVPFISMSANGARRWIGFGPISIQSSEVAKFGFVIFASSYMSKNYKKMKSFVGTLPVILTGGVMCLLILLEPNLSVTLCLGMVMLLMLVVGGMRFKHFLIVLIPALCLVPILIIIEPYRFSRLIAFINPWANPKEEGYQLIQSLYSLGSGGFFGVGLFNSRQKYLFLPFSESDFIFSIIGEETGFFGVLIVLFLYLIIITKGIKIAINAKDRFGCYLAFGITAVLSMQVLINIAVVSGSIPPTGIPLPFISAGGSSLMVFMAAIGVLCNIGKSNQISGDLENKKFEFRLFKKISCKSKKTVC